MSLPPKSKVIGRVKVTRLCGCEGEFDQLAGDRFGAQRLAKFQQSRCPTCAAKRAEEQRRLMLPKAEAFAALPVGTQVVLAYASDSNWVARLTAVGRAVEGTGNSPEAALLAVARLWAAGL